MNQEKLEELVSLAENLIRFESTASNPEGLNKCADFVADFFADSGLSVHRHLHEKVPSIFISKQGNKKPKILLDGHFDVVEANDGQFEPKREGDRLLARGALDMMSGNAVLMTLMKESADTKYDVGLMMTGDEERSGQLGARFMLGEGYGGQVVIIPDGGMAINNVIAGEKGVFRIALHGKGVKAHGAYPWKGENAVQALMKGIEIVLSKFKPLSEHDEGHWTSTCTLTRIRGGEAENLVPDHCIAYFDIRYIEDFDTDAFMDNLRETLPHDVILEHEYTDAVVDVPLDHELIKPFIETVEERLQKKVNPLRAHGSSDARHFADFGIPAIICQPEGAGHHSPNEWVSIPSIGEYYDVLRAYLDKVAL